MLSMLFKLIIRDWDFQDPKGDTRVKKRLKIWNQSITDGSQKLTEQRLAWMWRQDCIVRRSKPMTLASDIPLKKKNNISVFTVTSVPRPLFVPFSHHPPFSLYHSLPLLLHPPLSLGLFSSSSPFIVAMQVGLRGPLCCLICTAHSCSFIIVPLAAEALFFGQTMGGVVTESTVVMSHLPPRAISLSCPPSHPPSAFQ